MKDSVDRTKVVPQRLVVARHVRCSALAENFVNVCGIGRQLTQGNACAKGFFFHRRVCRFMGFFDSLTRQIDVRACRFLKFFAALSRPDGLLSLFFHEIVCNERAVANALRG